MEENDRTRHQAATPPTTDHRETLRLHNTARARKTLKPLQWDKKLETDAKAYARRSLPRISWYTLQVPSGQGRGRISLMYSKDFFAFSCKRNKPDLQTSDLRRKFSMLSPGVLRAGEFQLGNQSPRESTDTSAQARRREELQGPENSRG